MCTCVCFIDGSIILSMVKECVTNAAKELGYPEMKPEQLEVAASFIEAEMFFQFCLLALARVYVTLACH